MEREKVGVYGSWWWDRREWGDRRKREMVGV